MEEAPPKSPPELAAGVEDVAPPPKSPPEGVAGFVEAAAPLKSPPDAGVEVDDAPPKRLPPAAGFAAAAPPNRLPLVEAPVEPNSPPLVVAGVVDEAAAPGLPNRLGVDVPAAPVFPPNNPPPLAGVDVPLAPGAANENPPAVPVPDVAPPNRLGVVVDVVAWPDAAEVLGVPDPNVKDMFAVSVRRTVRVEGSELSNAQVDRRRGML